MKERESSLSQKHIGHVQKMHVWWGLPQGRPHQSRVGKSCSIWNPTHASGVWVAVGDYFRSATAGKSQTLSKLGEQREGRLVG